MVIKKKKCIFCEKGIDKIDFRDPILANFINERGKIISSKITGVCAFHQRKLAKAIKRARQLSILPFVVQ